MMRNMMGPQAVFTTGKMLPEDDRPWEQLGAVRRDVKPHRGDLLRLLGTASLVCGFLTPALLVPGVVGLPLAVAVLMLAHRDLGRMGRGVLDPAGKVETEKAKHHALVGLFLNVIGLLGAGVLLLRL
jgi:hypothetical protein